MNGSDPLYHEGTAPSAHRAQVRAAAVLFPDPDKLARFKARDGLGEMPDEEFLRRDFVAQITRHRHHCEWIERFSIAARPATMESGKLTPTLKVRRHFIEEKYADVIEEMYASIGGTK